MQVFSKILGVPEVTCLETKRQIMRPLTNIYFWPDYYYNVVSEPQYNHQNFFFDIYNLGSFPITIPILTFKTYHNP